MWSKIKKVDNVDNSKSAGDIDIYIYIYIDYALLIGWKRVHFSCHTSAKLLREWKVVTWVQITDSTRVVKISSVLTFCKMLSPWKWSTKTCTRNHLIIDTNMVNNFFQTWHRHSSFLPFLHGEWCTRQNGAREGKGQEMCDILAWDENKIAKINCLIVSYLGNVFDLKIMIKKKPLKISKKTILGF